MTPAWYIRRRGSPGHWLGHDGHWTTHLVLARPFGALAEAEDHAWRDLIVRITAEGHEVMVIRDIRAPLRTLRISPRPRRRRIPPIGGRGPDGRPSWSQPIPNEPRT